MPLVQSGADESVHVFRDCTGMEGIEMESDC